jgi:hypothetical protein
MFLVMKEPWKLHCNADLEGVPVSTPSFFINCKTYTMSKLSKHHFWEWFKRNNKEYVELNKKSKKEIAYWLNELNAHLRAYFKFFSYSLVLENKKASTLTITVQGKEKHFKKVEDFVAIAPVIAGWRIHALDDPAPIDCSLENLIGKAGIHPQELYFSLASDALDRGGIIVYHPLCTMENEHLISRLADAAIYNLIGEKAYGLEIDLIDVTNLSYASSEDVKKLEELPMVLCGRKGSMVVDGSGRLVGVE